METWRIILCNFSIALMPEEVALFHAFYRTSVKARKDLGKALLSGKSIIEIDKTYTSRVAEFFKIILKSLGFELEFIDEDTEIREYDDDVLQLYDLEDGGSVLCTEWEKYLLDRRNEIAEEILDEYGCMNTDELNRMVDEEIAERKYLMGPMEGKTDFLNRNIFKGNLLKGIKASEEIDAELEQILKDSTVQKVD